MEQSTAERRLVKSPPELWAEISTDDALGRRLARFGKIRVTRAEPETTVAWEGDRASGTVQLEPAGWGTKVTLTATPQQQPEPAPPPQPERKGDTSSPITRGEPCLGFLARLFRRRPQPLRKATTPDPGQPAPGPEPPPPEPGPAPTLDAHAVLTEVLDDLGAHHRRPFGRE